MEWPILYGNFVKWNFVKWPMAKIRYFSDIQEGKSDILKGLVNILWGNQGGSKFFISKGDY